jgi:predicted DNA-binding antitoxin AbrB/MazE fold protein
MDTNTLLEKRILINDGIKSEIKNISNNVKEYSQGSVKSFEIIETVQEAGLFKLTAKVAVRNENFSAYIKKIAQGETKVDGQQFSLWKII